MHTAIKGTPIFILQFKKLIRLHDTRLVWLHVLLWLHHTCLKYFWDPFEVALGFRPNMMPIWGRFVVALGSIWSRRGIVFEWGIDLGPIWVY